MDQVKDKRTAILEATLKLISEKGFHGTAMSMVAKEAGVSAGIIYHYFDSKDDLIDELYKTVKRNFGRSVLADFDDTQPLREQMRGLLQNTLRVFIQHPKEVVFVEQYAKSPYYRPEIEAEVSQYFIPLFKCIERAKSEKIIKNLPDSVINALTVDVAGSLAQQHAAGLVEMNDELIEQVTDACWEAVRQ